MTDEELIRIGIIAGRELNVPPDAKIEIAPSSYGYYVRARFEGNYLYDNFEIGIVNPKLWRWKREDGSIWEVGLGYSERCKTLVIWPDMVKSKPVDVISN